MKATIKEWLDTKEMLEIIAEHMEGVAKTYEKEIGFEDRYILESHAKKVKKYAKDINDKLKNIYVEI